MSVRQTESEAEREFERSVFSVYLDMKSGTNRGKDKETQKTLINGLKS